MDTKMPINILAVSVIAVCFYQNCSVFDNFSKIPNIKIHTNLFYSSWVDDADVVG
jgi:hypothetical protein